MTAATKTGRVRKLKVWALTSGGKFRRVLNDAEVLGWRRGIDALGPHLPVQRIVRATLIIPAQRVKAKKGWA